MFVYCFILPSSMITRTLFLFGFGQKIRKKKSLKSSSVVSRLFPIRIIDDSYLADVLNDWVLAPRMRTPVMVIYNV